jgi:hypothetical protein
VGVDEAATEGLAGGCERTTYLHPTDLLVIATSWIDRTSAGSAALRRRGHKCRGLYKLALRCLLSHPNFLLWKERERENFVATVDYITYKYCTVRSLQICTYLCYLLHVNLEPYTTVLLCSYACSCKLQYCMVHACIVVYHDYCNEVMILKEAPSLQN